MATFEEVQIAARVVSYLANCHRDLRLNAQSYLDEIARQPRRLNTLQLGGYVTGDAQNIARLMTLLTNKITGTLQTKLGNGLAVYGMTLGQANTEKNLILNTANTQAAADVSTDQAITSAANATLASMPAFDFID